MTKNILIKLTNNCVSEALNNYGFSPSKILNDIGWIRNTESGSINFLNFSYIPRGGNNGAYQIEPELIIIFPEVRNIYEKLTNKKSNYKLSFRTFSVLLADIEGYPYGIITGEKNNRYNWIIRDENDINELCYILKNKIEKYAIPYFELNSNLPAADLILNENLDSLIIHNTSFPYRAFHGLIIAHLTGRKNIQKIINKYDRIIKKCDIAFQNDYYSIRDFIMNQTNII